MGGGGPDKPELPPPVPVRIEPEVEKARQDVKERLRRARSRALSQVTGFGLLEEAPPTVRPTLSDLLG